jgi:sarcosine oxidase delta subunit
LFDVVELVCPYCGEAQEVALDPAGEGEMVQDCEVCCNPWLLVVRRDAEGGLEGVEVRPAQ